ncbi:MAG: hypothetical protein JWM80_3602 [Cyanobacteria bacterium RYN_339]|nr:hypothetical protein [Cyanobacteria bacterium RYN_339]
MPKHPWLLIALFTIGGCTSAPQVAAPPTTQVVPPVTAGGGGGNVDVQVSFKDQVVPILQAHCAKCHTEGRPAPFFMFNADGSPNRDAVAFHVDQMVEAVRSGKMPKDAPGSVSDAELATLEAWSQQGLQDN